MTIEGYARSKKKSIHLRASKPIDDKAQRRLPPEILSAVARGRGGRPVPSMPPIKALQRPSDRDDSLSHRLDGLGGFDRGVRNGAGRRR